MKGDRRGSEMEISAKDVKTLRDQTGAGLMDCKKALNECNGDINAAAKYLREKGLAAMAKRSDRVTAEGRIFLKAEGNKVAMIEVVCETDFVAKAADFIAAGEKLVALTFDKSLNEVTDEHKAVLNELAVKVRENMSVRRVICCEVPADCVMSTYVHHNFKIGSLVILKGDTSDKAKEFAHLCCLHLASSMPQYITRSEIPQSYIDEQTEILKANMAQDESLKGKPEKALEGILKGKLNKQLSAICFMDQPYIDNEKINVAAALENASKELGAKLSFDKVVLYVLGK